MFIDKNHPVIGPVLARTGYKGNRVGVKTAESIEYSGTMWSGGSRSRYYVGNLSGHIMLAIPTAPYGSRSPLHESSTPILPETAVVQITDGPRTSAIVYVHPTTFATIDFGRTCDLSRNEAIVLEATKCLKNTYGGRTGIRQAEARKQTGITVKDWKLAYDELVSRQLLKTAGTGFRITTEGRNAIEADTQGIRIH